MYAICQTKKNDVAECVEHMVEHNMKDITIIQTSDVNYKKLNNDNSRIMVFVEKHPAKHKINRETKVLHKEGCKKNKGINISARIISADTTGLVMCKCCK